MIDLVGIVTTYFRDTADDFRETTPDLVNVIASSPDDGLAGLAAQEWLEYRLAEVTGSATDPWNILGIFQDLILDMDTDELNAFGAGLRKIF